MPIRRQRTGISFVFFKRIVRDSFLDNETSLIKSKAEHQLEYLLVEENLTEIEGCRFDL